MSECYDFSMSSENLVLLAQIIAGYVFLFVLVFFFLSKGLKLIHSLLFAQTIESLKKRNKELEAEYVRLRNEIFNLEGCHRLIDSNQGCPCFGVPHKDISSVVEAN